MSSLFRPKMGMYRAKKLDIGCFVNIKIIRDHTKRQVFEAYEAERYDMRFLFCPCFRGTQHTHTCVEKKKRLFLSVNGRIYPD